MEIKDIRTITTLKKWIKENIKNRICCGTLRDEAEWFLACSEVMSWCDNRVKDNAYFILEGIPALKGNDEVANESIMRYWEDSDEDPEYLDDAIEMFTNVIQNHWAIEIVDGQVCSYDD